MAYRLFGDKGSGSAAIELALAEAGAEVELCDVPLDTDAQRAAEFAAVNPQRKLPALLTPDGELLTESAAILLLLAERYPAAGLLPTAPAERGQALRWLLYLATELYPVIEIVDYPSRFHPAGNQLSEAERESLRDHARAIWKRRWLLVEEAASGDPWFLASGFSVLDIYAAVLSRWGQVKSWRAQHLLKIERIVAGITLRPACTQIWRRHFG